MKTNKLVIGIIKERKVPKDTRVPLTPIQCKQIQEEYSNIEIIVESSNIRAYKDEEYIKEGITVVENLCEADIILGVKEISIDHIIPNKTYMFFSHTIKMQPYNQGLLRAMLAHNTTLIDYEKITNDEGVRLIGFGYYAGVVGAHHALVLEGQRRSAYQLNQATEYHDYDEMIAAYKDLPHTGVKYVVTGSGNVAKGAWKVLDAAGVVEIQPEDLDKHYSYAVYAKLHGEHLYIDENGEYDRAIFHKHPERYHSRFLEFAKNVDILINGIFWKEGIPRLFELSDVKESVNIKLISDVTCDIGGSVPVNLRTSTIAKPYYGVDKTTLQEVEAFEHNSITIMAIDNLPNELPRDASHFFGNQFIKNVLPALLKGNSDIIDRATICKNGKLNAPYLYLKDYAGQVE